MSTTIYLSNEPGKKWCVKSYMNDETWHLYRSVIFKTSLRAVHFAHWSAIQRTKEVPQARMARRHDPQSSGLLKFNNRFDLLWKEDQYGVDSFYYLLFVLPVFVLGIIFVHDLNFPTRQCNTHCRRLWISAKYNDLRALIGKIFFTLLMAKMHFEMSIESL